MLIEFWRHTKVGSWNIINAIHRAWIFGRPNSLEREPSMEFMRISYRNSF